MKLSSLLGCALLALASPLSAQALPGDSVYHLQAQAHDANGNRIEWSSLRGQARMVSMFYSNCHLMCPLIIETAKNVHKQLSAHEQAKLGVVMISLDPARDTPAVMRDVAQRHRVPAQWQFLVPLDNDVRAVASVLDIRYRPREDGSINHASVLVLLDAEGRVQARSEVNGLVPDPVFMTQIKALLSAP